MVAQPPSFEEDKTLITCTLASESNLRQCSKVQTRPRRYSSSSAAPAAPSVYNSDVAAKQQGNQVEVLLTITSLLEREKQHLQEQHQDLVRHPEAFYDILVQQQPAQHNELQQAQQEQTEVILRRILLGKGLNFKLWMPSANERGVGIHHSFD